MTEREKLEYLIYVMVGGGHLTYSFAKYCLGFKVMEDFNQWYDKYKMSEAEHKIYEDMKND